MSSKIKQKNKQVAKELVLELFKKADAIFKTDKEQSNKHIKKARRIAMKHKLKLGKLKRKFCKHCYSYLKPGINSRTRTREGKVIIYCSECKRYTRITLK
jgi:ribonuclease P protein subunit RPR2